MNLRTLCMHVHKHIYICSKNKLEGEKGLSALFLGGALSRLLYSSLRKDDHLERKEKKGGGKGGKPE
jgi:hypothetical protein